MARRFEIMVHRRNSARHGRWLLKRFIAHLAITTTLLLLVARMVTGIEIESWQNALLAALVLGVVNGIVRPIMVILTIPITVITFGLFLLAINALMLLLTAALVPGVNIEGFVPALLGGLLLSLLNMAVSTIFGLKES
jgi:putative membrane protein